MPPPRRRSAVPRLRLSVPFRFQIILVVAAAVASVSTVLIAVQAQTIRNQVMAERTAGIDRVVAGLQQDAYYAAASGGRAFLQADLHRRLPDIARLIGADRVDIFDSSGAVFAASAADGSTALDQSVHGQVALEALRGRQSATVTESDERLVHAHPFELAGAEHAVLTARIRLRPVLDAVAEATAGSIVPSILVLLAAMPVSAIVSNRILARSYEREQQLRVEARFGSLVRNASDLVLIITSEGRIGYVSPSVERVLGFSQAEVQGRRLADFLHSDDLVQAAAFVSHALTSPSQASRVEWRVRSRDGSWLDFEMVSTNLVADPSVGGLVLNGRDISERKALEEQLAHQAFHDPLTGLANRSLFQDRVDQALARAARHRRGVAVVFLDLDDFKMVNDSLGHYAGDRLLIAISERLKGAVREADTVARLGGDEFAVLLDEVDEGDLHHAAERLQRELRTPFIIEGQRVFVTASVGIAPTAVGLSTTQELLRGADVAMYVAKNRGKAHAQVFERSMQQAVMSRLELDSELRRAFEEDELELHYQPMVRLPDRRIVGVEALVRWRHPERGLLAPDLFVHVAEDSGLIHELGRVVLAKACAQAREWQLAHGKRQPLRISVNLSAQQIQHPGIVELVGGALERSGLSADALILEITETTVMHETETTLARLVELKALGVLLAIDDFGTGYSSLSYLRRFPVDMLKIDKSFIENVATRTDAMALTRAIVDLGRSLRLETIAEGVETPEQAIELIALGCDMAQGYLFGRPAPAAHIDQLLLRSPARSRRVPPMSSRLADSRT